MVERIVAGLVDGEAVDHGAGEVLIVGRDVAVVGESVAEEFDDACPVAESGRRERDDGTRRGAVGSDERALERARAPVCA